MWWHPETCLTLGAVSLRLTNTLSVGPGAGAEGGDGAAGACGAGGAAGDGGAAGTAETGGEGGLAGLAVLAAFLSQLLAIGSIRGDAHS
eukprot:245549-Chlamydomonas_euryale.AAC.1